MEDAKPRTTIAISQELKDWLEAQGAKTDTYEDILRRLLKYPNHTHQE